jgi:hypothetical protein
MNHHASQQRSGRSAARRTARSGVSTRVPARPTRRRSSAVATTPSEICPASSRMRAWLLGSICGGRGCTLREKERSATSQKSTKIVSRMRTGIPRFDSGGERKKVAPTRHPTTKNPTTPAAEVSSGQNAGGGIRSIASQRPLTPLRRSPTT